MISSNSKLSYVILLLDRGAKYLVLCPLSGVYLTPILILLEHKGGGQAGAGGDTPTLNRNVEYSHKLMRLCHNDDHVWIQ